MSRHAEASRIDAVLLAVLPDAGPVGQCAAIAAGRPGTYSSEVRAFFCVSVMRCKIPPGSHNTCCTKRNDNGASKNQGHNLNYPPSGQKGRECKNERARFTRQASARFVDW